MKGWRAWYDDGSVYSSAEITWQKLPSEGIVGVVAYLDFPYRTLLTAGDWYWFEDGKILRKRNHPEWGKWTDAPDVECQSCLKRSGVLSDDAFETLLVEMMEAREWP